MRCWLVLSRVKNKSGGFTFVEILLIITIFSIVGAGIAGTFYSGVKLWLRAKNADVYSNELLLNLEGISRDLRQSVYISKVGYEGKAAELSFLTFVGDTAMKVTYKFDVMQKAFVCRRMQLEDALSEELQGNYTERRVASLDAFSLSYFYFDKEKEGYAWKDSWERSEGIPAAVRINAKLKDEEYVKTVLIPIS